MLNGRGYKRITKILSLSYKKMTVIIMLVGKLLDKQMVTNLRFTVKRSIPLLDQINSFQILSTVGVIGAQHLLKVAHTSNIGPKYIYLNVIHDSCSIKITHFFIQLNLVIDVQILKYDCELRSFVKLLAPNIFEILKTSQNQILSVTM